MVKETADREREKKKEVWNLNDRPDLKQLVKEQDGHLFGPISFLDIIKNVITQGRHELPVAPVCNVGGFDVIWKSNDMTVFREPVNRELFEQVRDHVCKELADAAVTVRNGSSVIMKYLGNSSKSVYMQMDFDDDENYVTLSADQTLLKRLAGIPLVDMQNASFDFEERSIFILNPVGEQLVFKKLEKDFFYSVALIVAHTSKNAR